MTSDSEDKQNEAGSNDQVTLHSEIFRLERARALREVDEATGMPSFEPGSIERFADADGRTMAIVVSLGELCKQAVPESTEGEGHGQE